MSPSSSPCALGQLPAGLLQVCGAHDVIAVEDAARPVAGDFHGYSLRDALVDHVPDGGAPAIVSEGTRDACPLAGRDPRLTEVGLHGAYQPPVDVPTTLPQMRKQVGDDSAQPLLQGLHPLNLGVEERFQFRSEEDEPAIVVLRGARIKAQCLGFEIKLPTFEGEHFALSAPAVSVGDRRGYLEIIRQVFPHGGELLPLEEALARSSLLQLADDWNPRHMSVLLRQPERARQDSQLA